jgi:nicotinamidase-related amidase
MTDEIAAMDPDHAALLVMDYQYGTLEMIPHAADLLSRMANVIALARRAHVQIVHVWVAFEDEDYAAVPPTNRFWTQIAAGRLLHHADPARAIHQRVAPQPGDIVVRKTRIGPFSTTDLDEQLRQRGITTIVLAGISTGGVVLSTVTHAADHDYRVYVLSDGVADRNPLVHNLLIGHVFPNRAAVITTEEFLTMLPATPQR